jgi:hypothetical protein
VRENVRICRKDNENTLQLSDSKRKQHKFLLMHSNLRIFCEKCLEKFMEQKTQEVLRHNCVDRRSVSKLGNERGPWYNFKFLRQISKKCFSFPSPSTCEKRYILIL